MDIIYNNISWESNQSSGQKKAGVRTWVEFKVKAKSKIKVKFKILAELILLANKYGLLKSTNLNYINLGEMEPNIEYLRDFFILGLFY